MPSDMGKSDRRFFPELESQETNGKIALSRNHWWISL